MRSRYMLTSSRAETSRRRTDAAWSRADANGSIRDDSYVDGRITGPGQQGFESGAPIRGDGDQQTPAGLGVAEQQALRLDQRSPVHPALHRLQVAPGPAGK